MFQPGSKEGDGIRPFFACTLKPFIWIPSLPVSTRWLPLSTTQVQPPVPEAPGFKKAAQSESGSAKIDPYDIDPKHEESVLVGTDHWRKYWIDSYSPRARGCWVTIHGPGKDSAGEADASEQAARYFPQGLRPWSIGAWMEDAEISIPSPSEWKL